MNFELGIRMARRSGPKHVFDLRDWIWTCSAVLITFVIDILADPQVSVIALYAVLIVASVRKSDPRAVMLIGATSGILTLLGHLIGPQPSGEISLINIAFDIVALATITCLLVRIDAANKMTGKAQADLAQVSRLLLVEEMNTSLAHELNQPLGAAAANSEAAMRWLAASPPNHAETQRALQRAVEAIAYAGAIVHQRRDLASKTPSSHLPVNFARIIEEACAILGHQLQSQGVKLLLEGSGDLIVRGDGVRLRQVVINLLTNAIEAMTTIPRMKVLTIHSSRNETDVQVSFTDVGCGVKHGLEDKLFDLFHSSKPGGLGMGLAISRSIVRSYGGAIRVASNTPHGMIFTVCLPVASASV